MELDIDTNRNIYNELEQLANFLTEHYCHPKICLIGTQTFILLLKQLDLYNQVPPESFTHNSPNKIPTSTIQDILKNNPIPLHSKTELKAFAEAHKPSKRFYDEIKLSCGTIKLILDPCSTDRLTLLENNDTTFFKKAASITKDGQVIPHELGKP